MKALLALAALVAATTLTLTPSNAAPEACAGFKWGGKCWTSDEGREFVGWLNQHGVTAAEFKANNPQLASVFKQPWPPPRLQQAWQTCQNGYACAKAVVQHYFSNWSYALAIVGCETGGTYSKYVVGSAGEVSWWQFHPVHFGWLDEGRAVADPRYATQVAVRMSHGGTDWSPWTCARMV